MAAARTRNTPPKKEEPTVTDTVTDAPQTDETPSTDWTALLATAALSDRNGTNHRASVDVPADVLVFAQSLYNGSKKAEFAVTGPDQFEEMRLMWLSAGDKTTPPTSATVTPIDANGKKCTDLANVAKLRVSYGIRRGAKSGKKD